MRKSMTSDALPHRGTVAPLRVSMGLALAASAAAMSWVVGNHYVSPSEFGRNAVGETRGSTRYPVAYLSDSGSEFYRYDAEEASMTLEERVAALTAELAVIKASTAKLRENQSNTSEELSHFRASLASAEIGLAKLRTNENEGHQPDTPAQVTDFAQIKDEMLHLRMAQDDTATEIGSLRAGVVNSEIGVASLRTTTGEMRQQIEHIEAARDATGSIAKSHKHQGRKKWVAQR